MAHQESAPEPKTPLWLPALGAALFLAAGVWWAMSPAPKPAPEESDAAAAPATTGEGGSDAGAG